jgi:hypothetical protein
VSVDQLHQRELQCLLQISLLHRNMNDISTSSQVLTELLEKANKILGTKEQYV